MKHATATLLACLCWLAGPGGPALAAPGLAVFPAGPTVPENLLRIELRFAAAPRLPVDVTHFRLLDEDGRALPDVFLDIVLPDAEGRRFTVLLNPGRVKDGVGPNVAMGRALHSGQKLRLVVNHPELTGIVVKHWTVTAPDRRSPQPGHWHVKPPRPHSRDPLVVELDGPVSSTAESLFAVRAPGGGRLRGVNRIERGELSLRFTPARPWRDGEHALMVHPDLEDASGNRVCAAFGAVKQSSAWCEEDTEIPFKVR